VEPDLSIADFQTLLAERTGVAAAQQEVLTGFPPAPLRVRRLSFVDNFVPCDGAVQASVWYSAYGRG
jgi:hypothetical protein